jgi:hypothetical protein
MQSAAVLVVNNVYVNVHTEGWPNTTAVERSIALPPLTEHSMISFRTVQRSMPVIVIVGGFSKYLPDGTLPDPSTYNVNIYYSFSNGQKWQARGPLSIAIDTSPECCLRWAPPRSAAAIFAYERMYSEDTLLFVHGGRHYHGSGWTNDGALSDVWYINVEACLFLQDFADNSPIGMAPFAQKCRWTEVFTNPVPRYFHRIIKIPVAGEDHFVLIPGSGFGQGGQSAPVYENNDSDDVFRVYFFTGTDLLMATFHPHSLNFQSHAIVDDYAYDRDPLFKKYSFAGTELVESSGTRPLKPGADSALLAAHYNRDMDVVFVFGGTTSDFTRIKGCFKNPDCEFNQMLWMFKFDPYRGSSYRRLFTIGERPSKRAASMLIAAGNRLILFGGVDWSLTYRQDLFAVTLTSAHPSFTVQKEFVGDSSAGSTVHLLISASTIMKEPALSCETCFFAYARSVNDVKAPSYYLVFSSAGINVDYQTENNGGSALYRASFVPVVSGKYEIGIITADDLKSKITDVVTILPDITCTSTSQLVYSETVVSGSTMKFVVLCFDAFHNSRPGGDIISATVNRMNTLDGTSGTVLEPTSDEFEYQYTDLKSGSHSLELAITRSSLYTIVSKLGMRMIGDEVFKFIVQPKAAHCEPLPSTCNTLVIGQLDSVFAGQAIPM